MRVVRGRPLTQEEEEAVVVRMRAGDREALARLIEASQGAVIHLATRYARCGVPMGDVVSAGNIGLLVAAKKFDPSLKFRFITYANFWMRKFMYELAFSERSIVWQPRRRRAKAVPLRDILRDASLDTPAHDDSAESHVDRLVSGSRGPDDLAETSAVNALLARCKLTSLERIVIYGRFYEESTLALLGKKLRCTREWIRQIENRALHKLRIEAGVLAPDPPQHLAPKGAPRRALPAAGRPSNVVDFPGRGRRHVSVKA